MEDENIGDAHFFQFISLEPGRYYRTNGFSNLSMESTTKNTTEDPTTTVSIFNNII